MASPTSSAAPSSAPDPPAAAAAHPLPRPSFVSPPLRPPPLFSPQPLLGKPLNPPPPPPPQGFLYHHRGFPPRPAARPPPAAADQAVSVASPTGYIRNATPTAVMTFAAVTQARPFVYGTSDQMVAQVHVPIHHVRPPPAPSAQQSAAPLVVPRPTVAAAGPPQSIPVAALPKVTLLPSVSSTQENKNVKERLEYWMDARPLSILFVDHGCRMCSIYFLQSNIGDAEKLLPRPLPASMIDSQVMKQHENDAETEVIEEEEESLTACFCRFLRECWILFQNFGIIMSKELVLTYMINLQPVGSVEELSERDLLERHIKHAKSVRARKHNVEKFSAVCLEKMHTALQPDILLCGNLTPNCERNVFGGLNGANRDLPYSFLPQVSLAEMRLLHEIGWRLGVCYDPKIGISHQLYIFPFIPRQHEKALSPDG
ncbi:hypothetical protein MUK42_05685 [Musa troglodytarum]|uniref:Uncharacterized protein n=1 Tax=Musa troglodytarum TaxID=320322 RepID=A0A9E7GKE7_9LILI|nr:hypothetical protein MUK42_05685 [Musa troglodytarum]